MCRMEDDKRKYLSHFYGVSQSSNYYHFILVLINANCWGGDEGLRQSLIYRVDAVRRY
jgi:hypothetical protein